MSALPAGAVEHALRLLFPEPDPYAQDPAGWTTIKRKAHVWSKQRDIKESVRDNRYTGVHACHDSGKSWTAADTIAWWVDSHPVDDVFVVWTAPTYPQVNAIIGRELKAAIADAGLDDRLVLNGDQHLYKDGRLVGYGRKPADHDPAAFQGIHARFVLVVVDEADGIPKALFDAIDALVTNEDSRVLAIGNPDNPESHFARVCDPESKLGMGWNIIHIDGYDTPNFTGEQVPRRLRDNLLSRTWVEERKERWGETSALFIAKVRGLYAKGAENSIIPSSIVAAARAAEPIDPAPGMPLGGVLGVDVARDGEDENTIVAVERGALDLVDRFHQADLTVTADRVMAELDARGPLWKAVIDGDGLGAGVIDICRRTGYPVVEYRGSRKARHQPGRFRNRRAEAWWGARNLLKDGAVTLPPAGSSDDADDLASDLAAPQRVTDSNGRTGVEDKDEIRRRLGRSPDLGDAAVMAMSEEPARGSNKPPEPKAKRRPIMAGVLDEPL